MLWYPGWRNPLAADLQPDERNSPVSSVAASLPAGQRKCFKLPGEGEKKKNQCFDSLGYVFNVRQRFVKSEDVLAWGTKKNGVRFQPHQWLMANWH